MTEDYEDYEDTDLDHDEADIDATVEAIRAAWKCVPKMSLSELLDTVTTAPFVELSNKELNEQLNEFVLQNQ